MTLLAATDVDCELHDSWFLGQDVNAVSSIAFVVVGVVLAHQVWRRDLPRPFLVLAGTTALEGVGSMLFHGSTGELAQFLHDVPLVAVLGFITGWHVGRLRPSQPTERASLIGALVGAVLGTMAWPGGWTNAVVGLLAGVTVIAELSGRRRGLQPVWTAGLLVLLAVAVGAWLAGRSDSPLCAGDSLIQPHGLWHVLVSVVILVWADHAISAGHPDRALRLARRATDRTLGLLTVVLSQAFFRSVEVAGRERIPSDGPVLIVANHGNGFVDPIVLTSVLRRLPRFIAKAALWRVVVARPFLALAGVLPVHRRSDGDPAGSNRSIFEACHRELARDGTVAIFPEGTTGDRSSLDRVKSGAARIALGAVPGAPGLQILPVGLAFESRTETRGRALVMIGQPITPEEVPIHDGEPDHHAVNALTDDITSSLEAVSPEFASIEEREVLRAAARATANSDGRATPATFGEIEVTARRMAAAPVTSRERVLATFRRYATELQLIGLTDHQLGPTGTSWTRVVASIALLALLGTVVATATLIHLPALLLVVGATGAVRSTATKGTVRLLVGLVAGLATWVIAGMVLADGAAAVATGMLVALEGAVALAVWTPLTRQVGFLWGRLRVRDRIGLLPPVLAAQDQLTDAVRAATSHPTTVPLVEGG